MRNNMNTTMNTIANQLKAHLTETKGKLSPEERQIAFENYLDEMGSFKYLLDSEDQELSYAAHMSSTVKRLTEDFEEFIEDQYRDMLKERKGKKGALNPYLQVMKAKKVNIKGNAVKATNNLQLAALTTTHMISTTVKQRDQESEGVKLTSFVIQFSRDLAKTLGVMGKEEMYEKVTFWLVNAFCDKFPQFFEVKVVREDKKTVKYLIPTEAWLTLLEEKQQEFAAMTAMIYPMLTKPRDWSYEGDNGGFYTEAFKRKIIKGRKNSSTKGLAKGTIDSVNHIQSTKFCINQDILDLAIMLNKTRPATMTKMFPSLVENPYDNPPEFSDCEWEDKTEEEKNAIRKFSTKIKAYKKSVSRRRSITYSVEAAIQQAEVLRDEECIYFPHDLDYRVRFYNMVMTGLNTQGSDIQKGLIKLKNARAIKTKAGESWMKINLANNIGEDSLHIKDRVKWVDENSDMIRYEVENRFTSDGWHSWDKPLQAMACAIEYVAWLDNPNHKFHTHAQLDGKNNGCQHLTAMSRCHDIAPEVGLVDTGKVGGDLYVKVLNAVKQNLLTHEDNRFVSEWNDSGLVIRNLTKKPVKL